MHHPLHRRRGALPALAAAVVLSLVVPLALPLRAAAQDDASSAAPAAADAGTGVARIDALAGDVAIQRGDSNDTSAAVANAPVLGADYVTTGQDGHAEVGFDGHAAVRLGQNVQIRFSRLDPQDREMQLAAGTIDLRLFGGTDGQSTIDTPSISVVPRTAGSFRVSVDDNGQTSVTVRSGRADIVTPQGTQPLEPGTTLVADGPASSPAVQTQPEIASDDFDSYNADRDHIYAAAVADSQYVNTGIEGVGDLNAAGRWVDDGTYGNVWIPVNVAPDWAPYRDGSWVWEDGYGWTWVAAEPWGWAPYHYGRWYFSSAYHHWAWFPPAPARFAPAWSPALVGFVGFNIGAVSVGIGFGNIGWVPLAPYEAFHPWWGPHATTVVVNNTYINNSVHYRNMQVSGAMTSVTRENFQSGRFTHPYVVSQTDLRSFHAVPMQGPLPIVPTQANLRYSQRAVAPALAGRPAFAQSSFAGHAAVTARTPFGEQQASVSRVTHVDYRPTASAGAPSYARPAAATGANDPWSRFSAGRAPANAGGAAPAYARPASPSYGRPAASYDDRQAAPGYSRPAQPAYQQPGGYNRQAAPEYARPASPAYSRPETPAYSRPAAPAYSRQAAPAYSRPEAGYGRPAPQQARPAARATRGGDDRRDH
jgi:hypothetical protein